MSTKQGMTLVEVMLALAIVSALAAMVGITIRLPKLNYYYFIQDALDKQSEAMAFEISTQLDPFHYQGEGNPIYYNEHGNINAAQTVCFDSNCTIFELGSGRIVQ